MSRNVVPLREEYDRKRVDARDGLALQQVHHRERSVVHARQVDERVLHDRELAVVRVADVMGPFGRCNGPDQLRLTRVRTLTSKDYDPLEGGAAGSLRVA